MRPFLFKRCCCWCAWVSLLLAPFTAGATEISLSIADIVAPEFTARGTHKGELMGIGISEGDDRATAAAKMAVNSPLLDVSIGGAKGILFVVASSDDMGIMEVQEAAKVINESVDKNAKIIFGMMRDEKLKKGQIRIIVIATGFPESAAHSSHTGPERSLFAMPAERREEERGRIYHEILKRDVKKEEEKIEEKKEEPVLIIEKEEPIVTAVPHKRDEVIPAPEDDEAWGAIPTFLRRHKK